MDMGIGPRGVAAPTQTTDLWSRVYGICVFVAF